LSSVIDNVIRSTERGGVEGGSSRYRRPRASLMSERDALGEEVKDEGDIEVVEGVAS
jgi:hypothetical protein